MLLRGTSKNRGRGWNTRKHDAVHGRVWVRWQGSRRELLEVGVALERLGERHAALGAELVVAEPAHTAKERVRRGECSERAAPSSQVSQP